VLFRRFNRRRNARVSRGIETFYSHGSKNLFKVARPGAYARNVSIHQKISKAQYPRDTMLCLFYQFTNDVDLSLQGWVSRCTRIVIPLTKWIRHKVATTSFHQRPFKSAIILKTKSRQIKLNASLFVYLV